jgi:3-(3-hydroxy-phenyl)propionate hydroxylase
MSDVAVVGAGAVGLTLAARLAQHGIGVDLFEAEPRRERIGSKAICMQRETLEIWARLGIGQAVADRGIQWRVGRTYVRGRQLFEVRLPGDREHFPPFVNISQSEVEQRLEARAVELGVRIHRGHRFTGLRQDGDVVAATFETDAGPASHRSDYLVGTDGAHSSVRHALGIGFPGYSFDDRFLISDVRAELPFSHERHFHLDPPWNPGRQVLIHPQPDGVWRIDWQVPPETDAEEERAAGRLDRRIRDVIGAGTPYELVWVTAYRFSQRLADTFRVDRVFLAGDAAHVMSPFGARGLNSGVADAENLAWKLAWVLGGEAGPLLLDTYEGERKPVARENLAVTDATMRFLAPHGPLRRAWRNLVLGLAPRSAWFRRRVNSGSLAEPATYAVAGAGPPEPGLPALGSVTPDASLDDGGRLRDRVGRGFVAVVPRAAGSARLAETVEVGDASPFGPRHAWLVRPDGHLTARLPLGEATPSAIDELVAGSVR